MGTVNGGNVCIIALKGVFWGNWILEPYAATAENRELAVNFTADGLLQWFLILRELNS